MSIQAIEEELRVRSARLTLPREGACLVCYVYRMLEFGCTDARWITRYRDLCAPRATVLLDRLIGKGVGCDCEMFLNAYELRERFRAPAIRVPIDDPDDLDDPLMDEEQEAHFPDPMPACQRVRRGSTQPCGLWQQRIRSRWCLSRRSRGRIGAGRSSRWWGVRKPIGRGRRRGRRAPRPPRDRPRPPRWGPAAVREGYSGAAG